MDRKDGCLYRQFFYGGNIFLQKSGSVNEWHVCDETLGVVNLYELVVLSDKDTKVKAFPIIFCYTQCDVIKAKVKTQGGMKMDSNHGYVLRIELVGSEPLVWRRLQIPNDASFHELHKCMQVLFGWKS